jgi:hypothetical protein
MSAPGRRKVSTTIYITPEQSETLKLLNERTKVPIAEYIRQGIDLILEQRRVDWDVQPQLPLLGPEPPRPPKGVSMAALDELEKG